MNTEEFVKFIYNEDGTIKNLYNILGISSKLSYKEIEEINLCDNSRFFISNWDDKNKAKEILINNLYRKMYDDLLMMQLPQKKIKEMERDDLVQKEKRQVELIVSKVNDIYSYIRKNGYDRDVMKDIDDKIISRYIYKDGSTESNDLSSNNENKKRIDILSINNYYVFNITNNEGNTLIVTKHYFENFNRTTNLYGEPLAVFSNAENVILSNLRGLSWKIDLKKSNLNNELDYQSAYYYREEIRSDVKYTDVNDKTKSLCLVRYDKDNITVNNAYKKEEIYNEKEDKTETYFMPIYTTNDINDINLDLIFTGREIYHELMKSEYSFADTIIKIAFPGCFDEVLVAPYQKTKEYKRERGNVYYEHARIFNFYV